MAGQGPLFWAGKGTEREHEVRGVFPTVTDPWFKPRTDSGQGSVRGASGLSYSREGVGDAVPSFIKAEVRGESKPGRLAGVVRNCADIEECQTEGHEGRRQAL